MKTYTLIIWLAIGEIGDGYVEHRFDGFTREECWAAAQAAKEKFNKPFQGSAFYPRCISDDTRAANGISYKTCYRMKEMTNPTLPPPHVMEALRHVDWCQISRLKTTHHLRECSTHPVVEPCCEPWERAHLIGTDCEMISSLIGYANRWPMSKLDATEPGWPTIGTDLPPVRYCPWCGHSKRRLKPARRRR